MKYQALFSSNDKSKKLKCRLLPFLFGPLGAEVYMYNNVVTSECYSPLIIMYL